MRPLSGLLLLATLGGLLPPLPAGGVDAAPARSLDAALYAELLVQHTREVPDLAGTRVDYRALKASPRWRALIDSLAASEPARLRGREEQLAFWLNAYNILAIDVVLRSYPLASIRDAGSLLRPVWKREAGRIGGRSYSLDEIEHGQVRVFADPRVHAALVCASRSCPALRREPYSAERLDAQLELATRAWLADARKGLRLERESRTLWLSKIFDWFADDFEPAGGVRAFAARYAPAELAGAIAAEGERLRLRYLEYDWSLNDLAGAP